MSQFYVYTHAKPNGSVFYVGKGTGRRAWDLSPSRRKLWHKNVIAKHGRENIQIKTFPTKDETEAFELEKFLIAELRSFGVNITNLTDGGEGVSGRRVTEKMRAALAKGRGREFYQSLSETAKKNILEGLARGRTKLRAWCASETGKKHMAKMAVARANELKSRIPLEFTCIDCGAVGVKVSSKKRFCNDICGQRFRRRNGLC